MPDQQSTKETSAIDPENIELNSFSAPLVEPPESTPVFTKNRVWDVVEGGFIAWETEGADLAGASYPGPGVFGVDTFDFVIEVQP